MTIRPDGDGVLLTKTTTMLGGSLVSKVMAKVLTPFVGGKIIRQDVERIKAKVEA